MVKWIFSTEDSLVFEITCQDTMPLYKIRTKETIFLLWESTYTTVRRWR